MAAGAVMWALGKPNQQMQYVANMGSDHRRWEGCQAGELEKCNIVEVKAIEFVQYLQSPICGIRLESIAKCSSSHPEEDYSDMPHLPISLDIYKH